jgi:hypothetical protein
MWKVIVKLLAVVGAFSLILAAVSIPVLILVVVSSFMGEVTGWHKPVARTELPGTYVANYRFATEMLVLGEDGQFTQVIAVASSGRVVTTSGTWQYKQGPKTKDFIILDGAMTVMDGRRKMIPDFDDPAKRAKCMPGVYRSSGGAPQIDASPMVPLYKQ